MKRINLIPDEAKKITSGRWLKIHILKSRTLYAAVLLIAVFLFANIWQGASILHYKLASAQIKKNINKFQTSLSENQNIYIKLKTENEKITRQIKVTEARLKLLENIQTEWIHWVKFLTQLSSAVPQDLWISKVSLNQAMITINGTTIDNAVVSRFMTKLDASKYFKNTSFNFTQKSKNKDVDLVDFEVTTHIIPEKGTTNGN